MIKTIRSKTHTTKSIQLAIIQAFMALWEIKIEQMAAIWNFMSEDEDRLNQTQDALFRGFSSFLVHSEPCGGQYTEQNLLCNISFLQSLVVGTFHGRKLLKGVWKPPENSGVFWSKIKGVKKWAKTDDFLRFKRFLLSFAQFSSVLFET